jgi:hypothetical protein
MGLFGREYSPNSQACKADRQRYRGFLVQRKKCGILAAATAFAS